MKKTALFISLFWMAYLGVFALDTASDTQIDIYAPQIIESITTPVQGLDAKATELYQKGDYENAARNYILHLRQKPNDILSLYNLACCYGLLGKEEPASRILLQAYKAGFEDVEHIRQDPDFKKITKTPAYIAALDSISVWAERKTKAAGKQEFYAINTNLPYRIHFPENYDPNTAYNLLIGLHGYGDNALAFGKLYQLLKDKPFIFVVPEAPYVMPGSNGVGYSWTPSMDEEDPLQRDSYLNLNYAISELCANLKATYLTNETYLLGFSQGCFMTYNIGLSHPELFDGLLAFGGWMEEEIIGKEQLQQARDVKVFIAHGTADKMVEYPAAEKALKLLKANGNKTRLYSFDEGHRINRDALLEGINWIQER